MIHSSRRDRKTKAIAEVLAMIADAHPPLAPLRPCPVLETEEWLWESATEFCAAYAERSQAKGQIEAEPPGDLIALGFGSHANRARAPCTTASPRQRNARL
jgi:hypothetical protein